MYLFTGGAGGTSLRVLVKGRDLCDTVKGKGVAKHWRQCRQLPPRDSRTSASE